MTTRRADSALDKDVGKISKKILRETRRKGLKKSKKRSALAEVTCDATPSYDWAVSGDADSVKSAGDTAQKFNICVSVDVDSICARLDEFKTLEDGWLEGFGRALPTEGLDWLKDFFVKKYPSVLPTPLLAPTEEGGVSAEWFLCGRDVDASLDFNLETKRAEWHWLIRSTGKDGFQEVDVTSADQLADVFAKLREWTEEEA